jgi:hypothetical protein
MSGLFRLHKLYKKKIASNDFEFVICEIRARLMKKKIIGTLEANPDKEITRIADFLKTNPISIFPYEYIKKYKPGDTEVHKDNDNGLLYAVDTNGKIYLKRKYKKVFRAQRYYSNILAEQDFASPHRYTSDGFSPEKGRIIMDIGGAEGYFSLQYINSAKKIYIFECDDGWNEALRYTFAGYADKVEIIPKMVADYTDESHISIDDFIRDKKLENEKLFIKIDAEGSERDILKGAKKTIAGNADVMMSLCLYHKADNEREFSEIFKNCKTELSEGYMLYYYDFDFTEPYIRRGVMRIRT